MSRRWVGPDEGNEWMTEEIRALLMAIRGAHAGKKRTTLIRLAFARAQGLAVKAVFEQDDVCNERVWYQKWKNQPKVARAFEACLTRALAWRDEETALTEAQYSDARRELIAKESLTAIKGLALTAVNTSDRGDYRTAASKVLLALADEDLAERLAVGGRAALPVDIETPVEVDVPRLDELLMRALYGTDKGVSGEKRAGLGDGDQAGDPAPGAGDSAN